jgi:hypothetical protein
MRYAAFVILVLPLCLVGFAHGQTPVATHPLTFGNVFPGAEKTIDKKSANAAEFTVSGTAGTEVYVDLTIPVALRFGTKVMPIAFSDTDMAIDSAGTPDPGNPAWDNLDPKQQQTARLGSGGLTIWLGGRLIPSAAQTPGSYTADIILTVTPTGL